jgi:anti-sigma B factor antagonist
MAAPFVLTAPADFDVYAIPAFRQTHIEAVNAGRYRQVVDLSETAYIDSAGLGVLVGSLKRTGAHEGWVRLAAPQDKVLRVLRSTGLNRVFEIFDTIEAALASETEGAITS